MQLKPLSSPQLRDFSPKTGSRLKKKHKRLDAISETVYNQNHSPESKFKDEIRVEESGDLRRSSRMRRAPVVLDVSPPPAKKRKKKSAFDQNVSVRSWSGGGFKGGKKEVNGNKLGFLGSSGGKSWGLRLRERSRTNRVRREASSSSRKRKLFDDDDDDDEVENVDGGDDEEIENVDSGDDEEIENMDSGDDDDNEEAKEEEEDDDDDKDDEDSEEEQEEAFGDDEKLIIVKSKTLERFKALNSSPNKTKKNEVDMSEKNEIEVLKDVVQEDRLPEMGGEMDKENGEVQVADKMVDESAPVLVDDGHDEEVADDDAMREGKKNPDDLESKKNPDGNDNFENVGQSHEELEEVETRMDVDNEGDVVRVDGIPLNEINDSNKEGDGLVDLTLVNEGKNPNKKGDVAEIGKSLMEVEDSNMETGNVKETPSEVDKDLKTKKFSHDRRSRVKQGRRCGLCGCANDGKPPKRLMQDAGDSDDEAYSGSSASEEPSYDIWDGFGDEPGWLGRLLGPINDRFGIAGIWVHQHCAVWSPEVYFAGLGCLKNVRAALCRGKALKCTRCGRPGATIGCRVDRCPKTYHLPCARANSCIFDHRKFLIACTDHRHLFQPYGNHNLMRIKKLKARKMKLEVRKRSNDAWRKDIEAEEKWLENCGEDEEFLKRESKRLQRDLLRIAPVYIGGSESENAKLFEGWESVAGLKGVIQCMKEVVILPLLYPEFFNNLGITPPRGVLLHGYPGTGKTLVVRALIGSCSRGDRRIAYFARKGADCLGKYVGDAERQLRLLFQVAEKCQPSIIFFDEIDGLAPCRTRRQDQTHSSVVSTLLALMDGLKSRGSVVVIGATNRPEAVDPALRRPGRFDREIYFPLPSVEDRAAILSLHTRRWPKPVTGSLLQWVASKTVGFAGADLQALCTQAAIIALKRNFPLHKMLSAAGERAPGTKRIPLPAFTVEERDWLEALSCAPPPCSRREAGIAAHDLVASPLPVHLISCLLNPLAKLLVSLYLDERLWLPLPLSKAATALKNVIISTLERKNLPNSQWWLYVDSLLKEVGVAEEIQRSLSFTGLLIEADGSAHSYASTGENFDDSGIFEPLVYNRGINMNVSRGTSLASRNKSGYRILAAGGPRSGQRHVASCLLHCFLGNVEVQKVDAATISQEGHGDMLQGITGLLMKYASLQSLVIFMPRIDLWAVELNNTSATDQLSDETECYSTPVEDFGKENESEKTECYSTLTEDVGSEHAGKKIESCSTSFEDIEKEDECSESQMQQHTAPLIASHAWRIFLEQVADISVSTSLIILATSELPYLELPPAIKQFFESRTSNSSELTPLEHTVPRFSMHIGKDFDHDVVINVSAAKLLRDMTQLYVLLIHQKVHTRTTFMEHKFCGSSRACPDAEIHDNDSPAVENDCRGEFSHDHSKVSPPPTNRTLKGKSNLLLAISTFGYQILRCPHFAELCWITSKLKEGPCADASGPWKGWPFNSCIIRPMDKVPATSAGNTKSKDRYGLVRGLVAVGLSASRGIYKSLREVSFEVRKVLELLVGQVNEKIQAGKDRYRYIRILSQVAYLEDMVNNWAHTLQSLELDNQFKVANACRVTSELPSHHASMDNSIQNEQSKGVIPDGSAHQSEQVEGSHVKSVSENVEGVQMNEREKVECVELNGGENVEDVELNGENVGVEPNGGENVEGVQLTEGERGPLSEDLSPQRHVLHCDPSNMDKNLQSPAIESRSVAKFPDHQNGTAPGKSKTENENTTAVASELENGPLTYSNGFTTTEVTHSEGDLSNLREQCPKKLSSPSKSSNQIGEMVATDEEAKCKTDQQPSCEHIGDMHFSASKDTGDPADSSVVCSYVCCSRCIDMLQRMIKKILIHKWELKKNNWTVDDLHDVVSSLSVDLLSAVRKVNVPSDLIHENMAFANSKLSWECMELQNCGCRSWVNSSTMATECSCHSMDICVTENTKGYPNSGNKLEFVLRDGILVPVDSGKDVPLHCKYETLCLCSIIKSVVMTKQLSD